MTVKKEISFDKNPKQEPALKLMLNHKFSLLFGGSRCLHPDTLVLTEHGHKKISDVQIGERVASVNNTNLITYQKIVDKYYVNYDHHRKNIITFTLHNNIKVKCSYEHRLYFEGEYVEAIDIARRAVDGSERGQWSVQNIKFGKALLNELLRIRHTQGESWYNESCIGREWLLANDDYSEWEECYSEDAPACCGTLVSEYGKQTTSESYKSHPYRQPREESGMGDTSRKCRSLYDGEQTIKKQRRKLRNTYINRKTSYRNTEEIYSEKIHTCDVSERIRSVSSYDKRYSFKEKLEARSISVDNICEIDIEEYNGLLYDIEVEGNHNFLITEKNIISHNSGKSFIIMFLMLFRGLKKKSRHAVLRFHFSDVKKSVIKETLPDVAELMGLQYKLNQQDWYVILPNGSEIWFGGIDEGRGLDRILGKEYSTIWFNEASEISYDAYTTALTRLAQKSGLKNRVFIDENPPKKTHWTYKLFFSKLDPSDKSTLIKNPEDYGYIQMNPGDNLQNISEDYVQMLESLPKDKRKRFLEGEFADEEKGALFSEGNFNKNRLIKHPELKEVVVSIDPATTVTENSDETGITVEGKGFDNRGYLLEDRSGKYTPKEWAEIGVKLYKKWDANMIVAEKNQGGDMVKHTIQTVSSNVPVKLVHASKGKLLRAEPISALYDDDKISHVGGFPDAEDEMANYTGKPGDKSPNRLDSIVHGFTYLFPIDVTPDSEIFHRDNLKYFKEYDFKDGTDIVYIKITSISTRSGYFYNFTALFVTIKDKKAFLRDVIFNEILPFENIESTKNKVNKFNVNTIFVECDKSFLSFGTELRNATKKRIWQIKEFTKEDNRIVSETGFIRENIVFQKDVDSVSYKNFMQQLNGYTNLSEENEAYSPSVLSSLSYTLKKAYGKLF